MLELLIVMAITAILLAVAYPAYTSHLVKGRRCQAEIALFYLAGQLESFYSLQNTYQGATLSLLGVDAYTDDHGYQLSIPTATEENYIISATPLGQQSHADTACATLSLDERGEKSVSGSADPKLCWD